MLGEIKKKLIKTENGYSLYKHVWYSCLKMKYIYDYWIEKDGETIFEYSSGPGGTEAYAFDKVEHEFNKLTKGEKHE